MISFFKHTFLPILVATLWISLSEFARNEFLLKSVWTDHYTGMGLVFPSEPVNGAMWGVWSLCFAISIYWLARRYSLMQTTALAWFVGFLLMWLVTWNMGVLPVSILPFAIPLSLLESYVATVIMKKMAA
ncbi:MAG: hypothetical protein R2787_15980 [Saprospiraceae bacterium]